MKDIRLLPIVLFAVSALFLLKVVGVVTGTGSFAIGAGAANAQSGNESEAGADAAAQTFGDPLILGPPLDLEREARELEAARKAAAGETEEAEPKEEAAAGTDPASPPTDGATPAAGTEAGAEAPVEGQAPADGQASADGEAPEGEAAAETADEPDANLPYSTVRPEEFQPMRSPAEVALERALAERRQNLDQREEDLTTRLKLLEAAEGRLQARLDEMRAIQEKFDEHARNTGPEPSEQIRSLASMYENMKPKAAAAVFNQLDLPILIELSKAMNPRKMSAVMAVMSPDKASNLTTALAAIALTQQARMPKLPTSPAAPEPQTTQSLPTIDDLPKIMPAAPEG